MPIETGSTTKLSASADDYRDALRTVIDPEIFQNIVDLGLVYAIKVVPLLGEEQVSGDAVTVTMTLTSPQCPLGPQIMEDVEQTLYNKGAASVNIDLVWQPMWTPDAMTDELKAELGLLDQEEEPELEIELPPPAPPKKGWFRRLFGG